MPIHLITSSNRLLPEINPFRPKFILVFILNSSHIQLLDPLEKNWRRSYGQGEERKSWAREVRFRRGAACLILSNNSDQSNDWSNTKVLLVIKLWALVWATEIFQMILNDNMIIFSAELKSEQEKAMEKLSELQRLNETYTEKTSERYSIIIIIIIKYCYHHHHHHHNHHSYHHCHHIWFQII